MLLEKSWIPPRDVAVCQTGRKKLGKVELRMSVVRIPPIRSRQEDHSQTRENPVQFTHEFSLPFDAAGQMFNYIKCEYEIKAFIRKRKAYGITLDERGLFVWRGKLENVTVEVQSNVLEAPIRDDFTHCASSTPDVENPLFREVEWDERLELPQKLPGTLKTGVPVLNPVPAGFTVLVSENLRSDGSKMFFP
jgi:hypothetical protein